MFIYLYKGDEYEGSENMFLSILVETYTSNLLISVQL